MDLSEYRVLRHKGQQWIYYACKPCHRQRQRELYRQKKSKAQPKDP